MKKNFPFTLRVFVYFIAYLLFALVATVVGVTFKFGYAETALWLYLPLAVPMLYLLLAVFVFELIRIFWNKQNAPNSEVELRQKHFNAVVVKVLNTIAVVFFTLVVAFTVVCSFK
jgi:hypothetical protein